MTLNRLATLCLLGLLACSGDDLSGGAGDGEGASSGGSSTASGGSTQPGGGTSSSGGSSGPGGTTSSSGGGSSGGSATGETCKRGVAYGYHSEADLRALQPGISWWYNWAYVPDQGVRELYTQLGVEYVPMIWGAGNDPAQAGAAMPATSKTLLGFNEPNFHEQANLSAQDAAARWPSVQAVARAKGLKLVSPAVNFCGGGCQDTDPFSYLDDFFAACTDCQADAIAVHVYVGCAGEGGNHAKWLVDHLKTYETRFSQPIWLTEFACHDAKNEAEQLAFLTDAVTYLESDARVEKYAWFAGRADNVGHVNLLGADGQLTQLGQAYVNLPHTTPCR